jgi:aminoglycoside 3-N-acetyltransferase I
VITAHERVHAFLPSFADRFKSRSHRRDRGAIDYPFHPLMNRPQIRTLGGDDLASMRAMLDMFGQAFGEPQTYTAAQPDDAYLKQLLCSGTFVAVAALDGSNVIGGIAAYVLAKFEQARTELYIYDLAVHEAYRRRGVATAMIEELKRVALVRGIYVIFVQADPGDEAAFALYNQLGVREDVLHFDISPRGNGS